MNPTEQDILNNLSKYLATQGKTVAPTVEAIRRYNTPTPPPVVAPTPIIPTVDRTAGVGKLGTAQESLANAYSADTQSRIRRDAELYSANQRQSRIDAINATFAPRIESVKKAGEEQLSRVDAINFKRGITGSGADTTKIGEQKGLNEKALRGVEQEKSMLINEAFNQADKLAVERAALESGQMKEAALANVDLYKQQADNAISAIQTFGAGNVSLEDIKQSDPKTYDTLKTVSGLSDFEITNMLTAANPKNKILKTEVMNDGTVVNVVQKADGTIEVQRNATNINPKEKFETLDGVAYGAKTDANGNLVLRKLTSKEVEEKDPLDAEYKKAQIANIYSQIKDRNAPVGTTEDTKKEDKPISPYKEERDFRTIQSVDELLLKAKDNKGIFGRTAALPIPDFLRSSAFRDFESELNTLKSNISFGELTAMREASKTGGALGNVSDKETALLEAALGALNMRQSPENFIIQLSKIKNSINRWKAATNKEVGQVDKQTPQFEGYELKADGKYYPK